MKYNLQNKESAQSAVVYLNNLIERGVKIEIKQLRNKRTITQNRYLHIILSWWGLEFGYTLEEAKQEFKRINKSFYYYTKNNNTYTKSTSNVSTKELSTHIETFRNWSAKNGFYIPSPYEKQHLMQMQNEIQNFQYL